MSNGSSLKEGSLENNSSVNLFSCVSKSLFRGFHYNTYKYGLLKALLDNIFQANEKYEITMDALNTTFTKVYWNLVNVHHIPQSPISAAAKFSRMEQRINQFAADNNLARIPFDSLDDNYQKVILRKTMPAMKGYVFGAFYGDTDGFLYGFSKAEKKIWLNEKSFRFLTDNKVILEQFNYYEWLKMCEGILEKAHSHYNNLSTVLENITKRANLDYFKDELNKLSKAETCFYCGKHFSKAPQLDHVIPWDFIKRDDLWNFVFACSSCNASKNNRIPAQEFLDKLNDRNKALGISSPDIQSIVKTAELNGVEANWRPKKK